MKTTHKLAELVRNLGGVLHSPCSDEQISIAEKRLGFSLPESMREFYRHTNGASIHDNLWEFFTLEELAMHNSYRHEPPAEIHCRGGGNLRSRSLMIFADVMIDAPSYWLCVDSSDPQFQQIYCDGDTPWWRAAGSFDEFIDRLKVDIDDIFMGLEEKNEEVEQDAALRSQP